MNTSNGWVRANLLYDNLKDVPAPGSPLEAVCAFVFVTRQRAEYVKTKLLAQALHTKENADAIQDLLASLHHFMFPDVRKKEANDKEKMRELMERHSKPITINPM